MTTYITFQDSVDPGCDITEEEAEAFEALVVDALKRAYPDASVVVTSGYEMRVYRDGERDHDLFCVAQSVWEAGEFWS